MASEIERIVIAQVCDEVFVDLVTRTDADGPVVRVRNGGREVVVRDRGPVEPASAAERQFLCEFVTAPS